MLIDTPKSYTKKIKLTKHPNHCHRSHKLQTDEVRDRYLDLLKRFIIRYEFDEEIVEYRELRVTSKYRRILKLLTKLLPKDIFVLEMGKKRSISERLEGKDWPVTAESMIGLKRMNQLHEALRSVEREDIPGDIVETGVWRGGALIFAASFLEIHGIEKRKIYGCDSFEGLPEPSSSYPVDFGDSHYKYSYLSVSIDQVKKNLEKYNIDMNLVTLVKGWFSDTLHEIETEEIAILRLDGDMYSSTIEALDALFHKVVPGGYVIIDDFSLKGANQAVIDFLERNNLKVKIERIDDASAYFRIPSHPSAANSKVPTL